MNQENGELLSAYLDGALTDSERAALDARLQSSPDLRRELDELRAVSAAIKNLPREPLPQGFLSRFNSRRAQPPRRDWVFLPPVTRPIAFALSCGVVALVVWDKTVTPPEIAPVHSVNEASVSNKASAPVSQLDLSERLGHSGVARGAAAPEAAQRKESSRRQAHAPGSPSDGLDFGGGRFASMSEEARSAKNEQMINFIEAEKKKMGIARVIAKGDAADSLKRAASAPHVAAPSPVLLKTAAKARPTEPPIEERGAASPESGRLSPDAGLVFSDARSLASAWVLLGFPGQPPSVNFAASRLVLIKPSAAKIISVSPQPNSIDVVFRTLSSEESSNPASDRAAVIPLQPRAVLLFDATPR